MSISWDLAEWDGAAWDTVSPLPVVQILVAFNNGPYDDPAAITTVASPAGTLGGHNVWTDITAFVPNAAGGRGRQHELQQFEAGTLTLSKVRNDDGRFNPWNTAGPYYGKIVPMVPVQVRATWAGVTYKLFTGFVWSWAPKWDDVASQMIDIEAADAFRILAGAALVSLAYQDQVIADGASNFWPLSDAPGSTTAAPLAGGVAGTVTDSSDGYNGTPLICSFSGPASSSGPLLAESCGFLSTGALYSDTQNVAGFVPNYLAVPGLNTSGPFTVEAWLQIPSGTVGGTYQPYIASQHYPGSSSYWDWELLSGNVLQVIVNNAGGVSTIANANFPTDGKWHHVVAAYTSTALTIYIDGVQAASAAGSGYPALTSGQTTTFGGVDLALATAGGTNWSNIAFYTSALSATQAANHYSLGLGLGGPNYPSVDEQIKQGLTVVGWPSGAENILPSVQQAQNNSKSLISASVLTVLQQLERTEEGALFMDGAGRVTFLDRQTLAGGNPAYPQYAVPQVYFSDEIEDPSTVWVWDSSTWDSMTWGSMSVPYDPGPDLGQDELDVVNQAIVTRVGGIAQVAADTVSQKSYGLKSQSVSNALHLTDGASAAHASWIVGKLSASAFRLRSIATNLVDSIGDDTVANTPVAGETYSRVGRLLGLDLMHRVRVRRSGVGFEQDALVEGLQWSFTPNSWDITVRLSTTDTYADWGWGGAQ